MTYIGIPQIIVLALIFFQLGIELYKHGKEERNKHNFWASLIGSAFYSLLLYWGGFFR